MSNASLLRRTGAFIIDFWLLQIVAANLGRRFATDPSDDSVLGHFRYPGFSYELHYGTFALLSAACFIGWFLVFETATTIGSPGKTLFGLRLNDSSGAQRIGLMKSLARNSVKVVISLFGPLGLLYFLTARKRALPHDRWTGVSIVKRSSLAIGKWPVATGRNGS